MSGSGKQTAIIIQARTGSTRLARKVLMDYCGNLSILDIIINRFKKYLDADIWIATTILEQDDEIVALANKFGVSTYRGGENDVLSRFYYICKANNYSNILRVCADNPLISAYYAQQLVNAATQDPTIDYAAFYYTNDIPAIRTHFGFFPELISSKTILRLTDYVDLTMMDREHVTSYIYGHEREFRIKKLMMLPFFRENDWFRGTIDTEMDFKNMKLLCDFAENEINEIEIKHIFETTSQYPHVVTSMNKEIINNSK